MSTLSKVAAACTCSAGLLFLAGTTPGAQGQPPSNRTDGSRSENPDATLSPYFWVKSEDPTVDQLPLKSTSAKVSIAGVIADVKVTQVYKNEGKKALEAIYVFPGSTRAAVYGMKMTIGERTIQAQIREKEQARAEYEQAKQQGKSASLLEQQRPNVFQMNVANIMPGDEIKVELSYTELLVPTNGTYEFVYPTVVGPRYSGIPGTASSSGEKWVANPYTKEGVAPMSTFDMDLSLSAGLPIARMACETHKNSIAYDGAQNASLKLDASEKFGGNRDFILKYQLAGGQIQSGLLLSKGRDENFFLLMVQPPKHVTPATIPPREFVFIMDVSGSMGGYPIETSKTLMKDLVGHLRPQDRFNLVVFESGSAVWSPEGSRPGTPENIQQACSFVGSQSGGGGTEIVSALNRALSLPKTTGFSRTFVIATDGYISVEPKVLDVVRNNLGDANMFAFGIGTSVNRHLIEGIAHAGMGEPFVITRPEDAAAQADKFRQYIASPVLTQIKTTYKGFETYDVEPLQIPDVLAERPVIVFGKWKGEAKGSIEVSGISGSGAFHQSFNVSDVQANESNGALRFLWARHRIQLFGDYAGLGNAEAQKKPITELGLKYGLLTNYTSFIAIDSQVRNTTGNTEQVTQPLPLPQGVSNLAVGGYSAPSPAVAYKAMPSASHAVKARQETYAYAGGGAWVHESSSKKDARKTTSFDASMAVPCSPAAVPEETPSQLPEVFAPAPLNEPVSTSYEAQALAWLKEPALTKLMTNLPKGTKLELRVDASGKVIGAHFTKAFPNANRAAKAILKWQFKNWTEQGTTTLSIPLDSIV